MNSSFTCECGIKHAINVYPVTVGGSDSSEMSFPELEEGSLNSDIIDAYNEQKAPAKKVSKPRAKKVKAPKPIDVELVVEKKARKPRAKKVESPEPVADVSSSGDVAPDVPKKKRGRPSKLKVEASAMLEV